MRDYDSTAGRRETEKILKHGISIKNFWATPLEVFDHLDREFDFDLDAAAEASSAKCRSWLGPDHPDPQLRDALRGPVWPGNRVFLNPPYSPDGGTLHLWVLRAAIEAQMKEHIVLLLPGTTDTDWAQLCYDHADEIRFTPRIPFLDPVKEGRTSPMGASMVVVMRPGHKRHLPREEGDPRLGGPLVTFGYAPWKAAK